MRIACLGITILDKVQLTDKLPIGSENRYQRITHKLGSGLFMRPIKTGYAVEFIY